MVSSFDEILIQNKLEFQDSLKDLKNLRKQLYSAAEYFETSYEEENRQQSMIDSSKDYVAKALVNTIDHLGSVADKLNTFLDEKTNEFLDTSTRFSCIQQRLSTFQGLVDLKGVSQHSLMIEAPKHHKQYIVPPAETLKIGESKSTSINFISCTQADTHKPNQDNNNPFAKDFQSGVTKPPLSFLRNKGLSRISTTESSPRPVNFSFTRFASSKEPGKRSVSPLRFSLKRSGTVANYRSVSPSSFDQKRSPSVPRAAISVSSKPETRNTERETEPNTKRSKHLFRALLDVHWSRK
ncbi:hypothetical protein CASFOL_037083 [Castilleja foliolosa]|uniref:Uncharacterized protein n=1 Tax=Castilleja foliolosa TaxID=1961234 RepID=A0ABD3BPS9_9LAMI